MQEPILISITGMDRPGITASVTQVLAEFDVSVLDIGQSVIHDSLSLGMLVQIPDEVADEQVVTDAIQRVMYELHLMVRFVNISHPSYENWVKQQGKGRHIVTLLARRITAHHISRLARIVAAHGLNIDKITRLSGRVSLEAGRNGTQSCVEYSLRGHCAYLPALRREML